MARVPLIASRKEQRAVIRFFWYCLEVLPHPPYSPDLAPSDYHLFGPMKKMLGGLRFTSDLEAQTVVREWLAQQPASFFAEGIQKLVPRWDKCLNVRGGYVEK